jgi:hypothetical protein
MRYHHLNWILPDTWGQATEFPRAESSGCYYFKRERSSYFFYRHAVPHCSEERTAIWNCCTNNGNWQFEGNLNALVTIVVIATEVLDFVYGAHFGTWEIVSWPCILSQTGTEKFRYQQWCKSFWMVVDFPLSLKRSWLGSQNILFHLSLVTRIFVWPSDVQNVFNSWSQDLYHT